MTITFQNTGVDDIEASGDAFPTLPSGWQAGDIHICIVVSHDNVSSTMPAGWTAIDAGTTNGGSLITSCFYRRAVAGDTDPTVTHSGGAQITATIAGYRGCISTGSPIDVAGITSTNASSTITASAITTVTDNAMVLFFGGIYASLGQATTISGYSGTPTPTERIDAPNVTDYPEECLADFILSPAGSTGTRTATATNAGVNNGLMFALGPPPVLTIMEFMT